MPVSLSRRGARFLRLSLLLVLTSLLFYFHPWSDGREQYDGWTWLLEHTPLGHWNRGSRLTRLQRQERLAVLEARLVSGNDGIYRPNVSSPGERHPIYDLLELGELRWQAMLDRQSKTLCQAVKEYKRRYNRPPPKGFDLWYQFAVERNVTLIDEFDQIDHDITPFLTLPPNIMQARVQEFESLDPAFHLRVVNGSQEIYPESEAQPNNLFYDDLLDGYAHLLPDLVMHVSRHDCGNAILSEETREEIARLNCVGQVFHSEEHLRLFETNAHNTRRNILNACKDTSRAVLEETGVVQPDQAKASFIHNHLASANFCQNPSVRRGHGGFFLPDTRNPAIRPFFVLSKLAQGTELLLPPLHGFGIEPERPIPWSKRENNNAFWRGRTSGNAFDTTHDWYQSHRIRLHMLANGDDGNRTEVMMEDERTKSFRMVEFEKKKLGRKYLNAQLVGPPGQCSEEDGTCERMRKEIKFSEYTDPFAGLESKYAIDVDGNAWTERYRRLLSSGAVVLKMTAYPEWNTKWLIPWYHYVPVQSDYRDLFHSLAFFIGTPGPKGTKGHDEIAEKIAANSVRFVQNHWRFEDLQAYTFRLLLEYARAVSSDRDAMTYHG